MLAKSLELPGYSPFTHSPVERFFQQQGRLQSYRRHSLIYAPGDPAEQIYLIATGEVKLSRFTTEGRELTMDHLATGAIFGEMEILLGARRETQAVARMDLIIHTLDGEQLMAARRADPKFGKWVSQQMSARQARMSNRLESLLFKSANGKVAQLLVNLAQEYGQPERKGIIIDYPITHQEIGDLIATTRETVSYAFMEFREAGVISTRRRRTIIHDLDALGRLALA